MTSVPEIKPVQATRASTTILPLSETTPNFLIRKGNKSYKHQYSNIYFLRLQSLRRSVEEAALARWKNLSGKPVMVPRVLDVVKSQLCYIIGTVYLHMPLKPNVMIDIARDHSIPPPPPPTKIYSDNDSVMLEDESGRIRLVGEVLKGKNLVTGVVIGAMGAETAEGDFKVVDICFPELAPQAFGEIDLEDTMDTDGDEWIGLVSGLEVGTMMLIDAQLQMLTEYLTGEGGGEDDQLSAAKISRLIIAGNSLAPGALAERIETPSYAERKARKRELDPMTFTPNPIYDLSAYLLDIARVMPIHILPGPGDPTGTMMPQQPFPRGIFGDASTKFSTFYLESNPAYINIASASQPDCKRHILVNAGQPLDDMFKYLPTPPVTRLSVLESTLKWRHMAPTAPDTLWCHPYFVADPFVIRETPHLYVVGGQPEFGTKLITDETQIGRRTKSRIILVPSFAKSGMLVVVNAKTLEVRCVNFAVDGMMTAGEDVVPGEAQPLFSQEEPKLAAPNSSVGSDMMDSQQD